MPTLRRSLEYAIELLRGVRNLPPGEKDREAIAANIHKALDRRWFRGTLVQVDFQSDRCEDDEMILHIRTRKGAMVGGEVLLSFSLHAKDESDSVHPI